MSPLSGGPELAVLSHLLSCSIAIYEVDEDEIDGNQLNATILPIVCRGIFGSRSDKDEIRSRRNILIINTTTSNEKHACILIPTHAQIMAYPQ